MRCDEVAHAVSADWPDAGIVRAAHRGVCADELMLTLIDTYFSPNQSVRELGELLKAGAAGIDPLREFSAAAREEVSLFKSV